MNKNAAPLDSNEDATTVGTMNVYEQPKGRRPGTLDALWGDRPEEGMGGYPVHYGEGVLEEAKNDRQELLKRIFDGVPAAAAQTQKEVDQMFHNAATNNYEAHAPLLQMGKKASVEEPSISERLKKAFGRT